MNQLDLNFTSPTNEEPEVCHACNGKGWYTMAPNTGNEDHDDRLTTEHICLVCSDTEEAHELFMGY